MARDLAPYSNDTSKLKLLLNDWKFVMVLGEGKSMTPEINVKAFKLVVSKKTELGKKLQIKDVASDDAIKALITHRSSRPHTPDNKRVALGSASVVSKTADSILELSTGLPSRLGSSIKKGRNRSIPRQTLESKEDQPPAITKQPSMSLMDLLDVPIPIVKKPQYIYSSAQEAIDVDAPNRFRLDTPRDEALVNKGVTMLSSADADHGLGKRSRTTSDNLTFGDLSASIDKGIVGWQDLTFSRKTIAYLRTHSKQLLRSQDTSTRKQVRA